MSPWAFLSRQNRRRIHDGPPGSNRDRLKCPMSSSFNICYSYNYNTDKSIIYNILQRCFESTAPTGTREHLQISRARCARPSKEIMNYRHSSHTTHGTASLEHTEWKPCCPIRRRVRRRWFNKYCCGWRILWPCQSTNSTEDCAGNKWICAHTNNRPSHSAAYNKTRRGFKKCGH